MSLQSMARIALARTRIGSAMRRLPLVEPVYIRHAANRRDNTGLQWGIYSSYGEAFASIPKRRPGGWDHEAAAGMWVDYVAPVRPSTYPILFWLRMLLQPDVRLVDLGGSIGLTYYAYRKFDALPEGLSWRVVEVPHISAQGREVAVREAATGLSFESDLARAGACDILLAAGALQYMERSIPGVLEDLGSRPRYILVNKVALSQKPEFFTLSNYGPGIAPYRIFNEACFLEYFRQAGYVIRDRWIVNDMACDIPFYPEHTVAEFAGFCFERTAS
ncbi:TIGR04325 family methyltransferase [Lichenicoccus roseus]|uniref:Methyltransferase, TIGR04325 family n=1 Tax=Lichenicoccus roseus TaxID=2683649 RepID=A0A5R9J7X8_9PROT|nr:TIGR04325 family methyltransferase [Lichenicoccus roseus]TLU73724.1 methyltransferase, TIGR04325 family [Lichenicoccus roseus]